MNYTPIDIDMLKNRPLSQRNYKLWIVIIAILVVLFQAIKVQPGQFINPLTTKKDAFPEVKAKLAKIKNNYSLHTQNSIIPQVYADTSTTAADSNAYAVIDFDTGDIIAQKNLSQKVSIASLTKIMTAAVALDLASPDELFLVTQEAANKIPTKIAVQPGERMSLWELLHASLMTSANDATEVIRDGVDAKYGQPVFIDAMNAKAKMIGLKNTHFVNPQGFDNPDHYSTAEDLAVLSHYVLTNYPLIDEIVKKDEVFLPANAYHGAHRLVNWNGLLDVYPDVYGLKIGNTDWAGTTTVVVSQRNGKKVLVVLLGASNVLSRDLEAADLLDLGYEQLLNLPPVAVTADQLREKYTTWN